MQSGLLPAEYPTLKQLAAEQGEKAAKTHFRQGKKGPFAEDYGSPASLLRSAREVSGNQELLRLFKETRKGDILLVDYNNPGEFIAGVTRGRFTHTFLCTADGPPPEFMEAVGITGDQSEPSNNRVRVAGYNHALGNGVAYRKINPADHLPEPQRSQAIDKAIAYARAQLGKPYDYTFGQVQVGQAFICSSLAYYAYTKGAGIEFPISKSPDRDRLVEALGSMVDALEPADRLKVMTQVATMINRKPRPTEQQLIDFIVEDILPNCKTTSKLFRSARQQDKFEAAIKLFRSGKGLPRFDAASSRYDRDEKAGKFRPPMLGFLRKQVAKVRIGVGAARDVVHAFRSTGMSPFETVGAVRKLAWAALPYSEALAGLAFGRDDGRTKFFTRLLDTTQWLKGHPPTSWASGWLPARAVQRIDRNFISPTDLAWSDLPHKDYGVPPGVSLDAPLKG